MKSFGKTLHQRVLFSMDIKLRRDGDMRMWPLVESVHGTIKYISGNVVSLRYRKVISEQ